MKIGTVIFRTVFMSLVGVLLLSVIVVGWVRGWVFPALLAIFVALLLGWGWFDNRFVYFGRRPQGGSGWGGPTPHENRTGADNDAWFGGGGGF
jgi:hypothetical protein